MKAKLGAAEIAAAGKILSGGERAGMGALHVIAHVILQGAAQRRAEPAIGGRDLKPAIGDAGLRCFLGGKTALVFLPGEFGDQIVDLLILLLQTGFDHGRRRRWRRRRRLRHRFWRGKVCAFFGERAFQRADFLLLRLDHLLHLIQPLHHGIVGLRECGRRGGSQHGGSCAQQENTFHLIPSNAS